MYAFQWMVDRSEVDFQKLELILRPQLFVDHNLTKTMNLLDRDQLPRLRKLSLQFCELQSIPPIKTLPLLEELDLSFNQITECSRNLQLPNLKLLDLTRNGIKRIDIEVTVDSIPALKTLLCGSCITKYISLHISKLVAMKELTVEIKEEFQKVLCTSILQNFERA